MISAAPQLFALPPVKTPLLPPDFRLDGARSRLQRPVELLQMKMTLKRTTRAETWRRRVGGIWRGVRANRYDFKASELSRLKNTISVILPDTFSHNLSFCLPPSPQRGRKEVYFLVILYKVERRVSSWSLISCTLKTVCMQGALRCYQGDGCNFKLSVSRGNIRET